MEVSIFLAKVFGIYLILGGLLYALRYETMRAVVSDYFDNNALVLLGGTICLIIGTLLIVSHSVWELNWRVLITLMGYVIFFKGIMLWFFPSRAAAWAVKMIQGSSYVYISILSLMLGVYLTYVGFSLS